MTAYKFKIGTSCYNKDELIYEGDIPETLAEAQEISVAKWKFMAKQLKKLNRRLNDCGSSTCGFCMIYYGVGCRGCPISTLTGQQDCKDTPYKEYYAEQNFYDIELLIKACKKEAKFLKELVIENKYDKIEIDLLY